MVTGTNKSLREITEEKRKHCHVAAHTLLKRLDFFENARTPLRFIKRDIKENAKFILSYFKGKDGSKLSVQEVFEALRQSGFTSSAAITFKVCVRDLNTLLLWSETEDPSINYEKYTPLKVVLNQILETERTLYIKYVLKKN